MNVLSSDHDIFANYIPSNTFGNVCNKKICKKQNYTQLFQKYCIFFSHVRKEFDFDEKIFKYNLVPIKQLNANMFSFHF